MLTKLEVTFSPSEVVNINLKAVFPTVSTFTTSNAEIEPSPERIGAKVPPSTEAERITSEY